MNPQLTLILSLHLIPFIKIAVLVVKADRRERGVNIMMPKVMNDTPGSGRNERTL